MSIQANLIYILQKYSTNQLIKRSPEFTSDSLKLFKPTKSLVYRDVTSTKHLVVLYYR